MRVGGDGVVVVVVVAWVVTTSTGAVVVLEGANVAKAGKTKLGGFCGGVCG